MLQHVVPPRKSPMAARIGAGDRQACRGSRMSPHMPMQIRPQAKLARTCCEGTPVAPLVLAMDVIAKIKSI